MSNPWTGGGSPWDEIRRLRDDLDRLMQTGFGGGPGEASAGPGWSPAMDVIERPDEFVPSAELPGLSMEDVTVDVEDDVLVIRGEKRAEREEDEREHRLERSYGSFTRSFTLPPSADPERIRARFRNGVLTVVMPKTGKGRGRHRRIDIEGGPEA